MLVVPPAPYRLWGHVDLSSQLALAHARLGQCAEIRSIVHIAVIGEISSIHERKQDLVLVGKPNNRLVAGRHRIVLLFSSGAKTLTHQISRINYQFGQIARKKSTSFGRCV